MKTLFLEILVLFHVNSLTASSKLMELEGLSQKTPNTFKDIQHLSMLLVKRQQHQTKNDRRPSLFMD